MEEPFHRTRPDVLNEYERYFLVDHPAGNYVRRERIRLHPIAARPCATSTEAIELDAFLSGNQCPIAKDKLQALLQAARV